MSRQVLVTFRPWLCVWIGSITAIAWYNFGIGAAILVLLATFELEMK